MGGICDPTPEARIVEDEESVITDFGDNAEDIEVEDAGADGERRSVSHDWPFCPYPWAAGIFHWYFLPLSGYKYNTKWVIFKRETHKMGYKKHTVCVIEIV